MYCDITTHEQIVCGNSVRESHASQSLSIGLCLPPEVPKEYIESKKNFRGAGRGLGAKGASATASGIGVGVGEDKSASHDFVFKVNGGAIEIEIAFGIADDFDAI